MYMIDNTDLLVQYKHLLFMFISWRSHIQEKRGELAIRSITVVGFVLSVFSLFCLFWQRQNVRDGTGPWGAYGIPVRGNFKTKVSPRLQT